MPEYHKCTFPHFTQHVIVFLHSLAADLQSTIINCDACTGKENIYTARNVSG